MRPKHSLIAFLMLSACAAQRKLADQNRFTDPRDGHVYKTVTIGNQVWMAENLDYAMKGSIWPDYNDANDKLYGRLYNFDMLLQGAAPKGWHVPSNAEWDQMIANCPDPVQTLNIQYAGEFSARKFRYVGEAACFYTSTQDGAGPIFTRVISKGNNKVGLNRQGIGWMLSVRCVKDAKPAL